MEFFRLQDIELQGKKVLVRVDFNVPLKDGVITNDKRIRAALPTIKHLLDNGAAVILMSHLGRPKGEGFEDAFSLKPTATRLSELLGIPVQMASDCVGSEVEAMASSLQMGEVLLLENLRFHKAEKKGDSEFAQQLASLADVYVNDGFGCCHRAHASYVPITEHLPSCAGLLVQEEIEKMLPVVKNPEKPYVAILGGAKISDKLKLIKKLLPDVDRLLIGGAMVFTFFKAQGMEVGTSLVEDDFLEEAKNLLIEAGQKIILPLDVVIAHRFADNAPHQTVLFNEMKPGYMGLDVGPDTVNLFGAMIRNAKTVLWNGPMGVFEFDSFAKGTEGVAKIIAEHECISIIGGGDSAAAIEKLGMSDKMTHVSTGGGATLELFESGTLPALDALAQNYKKNKTN